MADDWAWKAKGGARPGLLYEPGNWGDLLKAAWVLRVLAWMRSRGDALIYLDICAGAPCYPMPTETALRLRSFRDPVVDDALALFGDETAWPSAARLAMVGTPPGAAVQVFDADADRRNAWHAVAGAEVLSPAGEKGWNLLKPAESNRLILVDPYDLVAEPKAHVIAMLEAAQSAPVLAYIYNRSARGPEMLRAYRRLRHLIDDAWGRERRLLGRVPADSFLPRAHHEMLLLAPARTASWEGFAELLDSLADVTRRLHQVILDRAVVER